MRKIISILVTLGVILGMTLMAVPVAAQVDCPDDCTPITIADLAGPPDFCAGMVSDYLLGDVALTTDITLPVSLVAGLDSLSVDFPSDTDLSDVDPADVIVTSTAGSFSPTAITVTGQHLSFVVPIGFWPGLPAGAIITIEVDDVVNPTVDGDYCLFVDYMIDCCTPIQFDCVEYTVAPAYKEYAFHFDFGKTFALIAEDFIPPFKACGQDGFGVNIPPTGWFDVFDLILRDENGGCLPPCDDASMWFVLTACPAGETVTFIWDELGIGIGPVTYVLGAANVGDEWPLPDVDLTLGPPPDVEWECKIHFSSPGDYELCFYLECPAVPCAQGAQIIAEECLPAKVHQWKDAAKIELDEKWNLISLPLVPFDTSIANLLLSLDPEALDGDGVDDLISIWHYAWDEACTSAVWKSWPGPGLTTMEDGKGYWARLTYPITASPAYNWWVFGTYQNMPPLNPLAYDMCPGWDMFGFTSLASMLTTTYLWNFGALPNLPYPLTYGWDNTGDWTTSDWIMKLYDGVDTFEVGQGYWGYFQFGGTIVP